MLASPANTQQFPVPWTASAHTNIQNYSQYILMKYILIFIEWIITFELHFKKTKKRINSLLWKRN